MKDKDDLSAFTPIEAILFDLDGTLVDSYTPIAESLNHSLVEMGFPPLSQEKIRRMVGRGMRNLMAEAGDEAHVDEGIGIFRSRYRTIYLEQTVLLPGVARTVAALSERGYAMGVVTNKPGYFSREIIAHLGLGKFLPVLYGSEMVSRGKPDPEMVVAAMAELGVVPEATCIVGDMEIDIQTARAAGLRSIAVPSGSRDRGELEAARPDLLIDAFDELLSLFGEKGCR